jgi:hypothetical protein
VFLAPTARSNLTYVRVLPTIFQHCVTDVSFSFLLKHCVSKTSNSITGLSLTKNGNTYSLEYTYIQKVFFTPHHVGHFFTNTIRRHSCVLGHYYTNAFRRRSCAIRMFQQWRLSLQVVRQWRHNYMRSRAKRGRGGRRLPDDVTANVTARLTEDRQRLRVQKSRRVFMDSVR